MEMQADTAASIAFLLDRLFNLLVGNGIFYLLLAFKALPLVVAVMATHTDNWNSDELVTMSVSQHN